VIIQEDSGYDEDYEKPRFPMMEEAKNYLRLRKLEMERIQRQS
jgi:hypothetical protein